MKGARCLLQHACGRERDRNRNAESTHSTRGERSHSHRWPLNQDVHRHQQQEYFTPPPTTTRNDEHALRKKGWRRTTTDTTSSADASHSNSCAKMRCSATASSVRASHMPTWCRRSRAAARSPRPIAVAPTPAIALRATSTQPAPPDLRRAEQQWHGLRHVHSVRGARRANASPRTRATNATSSLQRRDAYARGHRDLALPLRRARTQ